MEKTKLLAEQLNEHVASVLGLSNDQKPRITINLYGDRGFFDWFTKEKSEEIKSCLLANNFSLNYTNKSEQYETFTFGNAEEFPMSTLEFNFRAQRTYETKRRELEARKAEIEAELAELQEVNV